MVRGKKKKKNAPSGISERVVQGNQWEKNLSLGFLRMFR